MTSSPRIIAVGSPKGGVGKTTTAVHLAGLAARSGRRVLLVDADENRSAAAWAKAAGDRLDLDVAEGHDSPRELAKLRRASGYDLVVVDLPGVRGDALAALATPKALDLLVCPTRPGVMDVQPLAGLLAEVDVPSLVVLTMTDPRWTARADDVRAQLTAEPFGWTLARTAVRRSQAWADARDAACLVVDLPNASTAQADATGLALDVQEF
ncbi:ParA family protein [Dermacoccus nishinomiyaensis]